MKIKEAVAQRITNLCKERGIAINAFGNLSGVNPSTIYRNQIIKITLAPDFEPYLLCHTFCTDCQAAGVPLNVAKEWMGHSDISVTSKIYTHMVDEVFNQTESTLKNMLMKKEASKLIEKPQSN